MDSFLDHMSSIFPFSPQSFPQEIYLLWRVLIRIFPLSPSPACGEELDRSRSSLEDSAALLWWRKNKKWEECSCRAIKSLQTLCETPPMQHGLRYTKVNGISILLGNLYVSKFFQSPRFTTCLHQHLHLVQPLNFVEFADGLIFSSAPRQGFLRPPCTYSVSVVSSELNEVVLPVAVRKHSKEELIAFFRDIQTSIAETSPKASRRTRKPSPDLFEKVDKRTQPYGML